MIRKSPGKQSRARYHCFHVKVMVKSILTRRRTRTMVRAVKSPAPPSATRFRRAVSPTSRHQAAPLCINSPPRCSLHLPRASAPLIHHGGSSSIATNREWPSSPHAPASKLPSHREPPSSPHAPASKLPGHREPPHPRDIKSPLQATVASPSNRRSLAPGHLQGDGLVAALC